MSVAAPTAHGGARDATRPAGAAVATRGMTKRFGSHTAVDAVDLIVPTGSVFGFLGPNGSGKTTSIRMLLGLSAPTGGDVEVLGGRMPRDTGSVLPHVGALVEGPAFLGYLSGTANLARLDAADPSSPRASRRVRIDSALERVGLTRAAGAKVKAYSLGMRQRLGIAGALLMPRELLVLDEPTNGLDPQGTREVRTLVRSLADDGTTVVVSSHLLAEIEQMCSHAAVMSAGRLLAQGTLDEVRRAGRATLRLTTPDGDAARAVLARLGIRGEGADGVRAGTASPAESADASAARAGATRVVAQVGADAPAPEEIVAALVAAGVRVRSFDVAEASLEDRFVELTGEGFEVVR